MKEVNNGTSFCDKPLDEEYWDKQYQAKTTGWDLGQVSPPIKEYFDKLQNKSVRILIPGCGNAYEAAYLLQNGFTNITVIDIAPTVVASLQKKFVANSSINIIQGDFFDHNAEYDIIVEQTFFCALPSSLRKNYVVKMHQLLCSGGKLVGLLFNRTFEQGPPFGGSKNEYENLFANYFSFEKVAICKTSISPRANTELWIEFNKKNINEYFRLD
ncbi:MAG: methyltransferase domain-containing protein [Ferruginibacter sp.]|nr:methyltransferase domain-containing protein [Ferruginibacter sp.]